MDTDRKTLAELSSEAKEKKYVTLEVGSKISGYTKEYLDRLCNLNKIDHRLWSKGGVVVELQSLLNATHTLLISDDEINFVDKRELVERPEENIAPPPPPIGVAVSPPTPVAVPTSGVGSTAVASLYQEPSAYRPIQTSVDPSPHRDVSPLFTFSLEKAIGKERASKESVASPAVSLPSAPSSASLRQTPSVANALADKSDGQGQVLPKQKFVLPTIPQQRGEANRQVYSAGSPAVSGSATATGRASFPPGSARSQANDVPLSRGAAIVPPPPRLSLSYGDDWDALLFGDASEVSGTKEAFHVQSQELPVTAPSSPAPDGETSPAASKFSAPPLPVRTSPLVSGPPRAISPAPLPRVEEEHHLAVPEQHSLMKNVTVSAAVALIAVSSGAVLFSMFFPDTTRTVLAGTPEFSVASVGLAFPKIGSVSYDSKDGFSTDAPSASTSQ